MDIFRKLIQSMSNTDKKPTNPTGIEDFSVPQRSADREDVVGDFFDNDADFFAGLFSNEFEKHVQRMLKSFGDLEVDVEEKKFVDAYKNHHRQVFSFEDNDLDKSSSADKIAEQILQKIDSGAKAEKSAVSTNANLLPPNVRKKHLAEKKLSDEELIMGRIHGTLSPDGSELYLRPKLHGIVLNPPDFFTPTLPLLPRSFPDMSDEHNLGPRAFSKSVITTLVRKPDGSYESTQITQDSTGKKVTTVTRSDDGKSKVVSTHIEDEDVGFNRGEKYDFDVSPDRNLYISNGYFLPRNLF